MKNQIINKMKLNSRAIHYVVLIFFIVFGTPKASDIENQITSDIEKSYVYKTYLDNDDISIEVTKDGVVTLSGEVAVWSHRLLAEETAIQTRNVKKVNNKLKVKEKEENQKSDTWIAMKIKAVLVARSDVSGLNTEVIVDEGNVTLKGKVSSKAEKALTGEYAKDVEGVKNVNNELVVSNSKSTVKKATEQIDDASITAQAKITLLFQSGTSAIETKIVTDKGIVTVEGVAKNSAEKTLVSKLIKDIKGVKQVNNNMRENK